MSFSSTFPEDVQQELSQFLTKRAEELAPLGEEIDQLITHARPFLNGGKRLRAWFTYWGWQAVTTNAHEREYRAVVRLASALELFHAAALVHDDLIDNSDTRRGMPAIHRSFERTHREAGWRGSAEAFGRSSAILLGDLLQFWSDMLFAQALTELPRSSSERARAQFSLMRTQVGGGQYLDVLEEQLPLSHTFDIQQQRSLRVLIYKSAKYSVEAPLLIGAALGGNDTHSNEPTPAEQALAHFGVAVGTAYQLRDDLLGAFGEPEVTGKPAGGDLLEGKHTLLVAHTRHELAQQGTPTATTLLHRFDELFGNPALTVEGIAELQHIIRSTPAVRRIETHIADVSAEAVRSLGLAAESGILPNRDATTALTELCTQLAGRTA